jgi:hypothetical protein
MTYLRSLTAEDGSVRYSRSSRQTPVWVTGQAVAALSRKALPLKPVPRDRRAASSVSDGGEAASAGDAAATPAGDAAAEADDAATPQPLPPVATAAPTLPAAVLAVAGVPAVGHLAAALVGSGAHV